MGTTLVTTVGWGFPLTEEDVEKLDRLAYDADPKAQEEYEDFEDYQADYAGESLWGLLRDFKNWDYSSSYFYDYYPDENRYYVYLKRLTKTFYGVGFHEYPDEDEFLALSNGELQEFEKIKELLGRDDIQWDRFVQTSVG